MRDIVLVWFLFFSVPVLWGQELDTVVVERSETDAYGVEDPQGHELEGPDALETTRTYRSEKLQIRRFDEQKWKQVVGDADFREEEEKVTSRAPEMSLPWGGRALKLISYIVIIAVIILLVVFVVRNLSFDLRIKRTELQPADIAGGVENIEEVDIQGLLEKARAEGNLRLAVRLYYLDLLKKLHASNAIIWKKDKTNRDYLAELFLKGLFYEDVRYLTRSYEAVWYGEHVLRLENFQHLTTRFEDVFQKIVNGETA